MKHFCLCELLHKIVEDANFEGKKQQKNVLLESCGETIIHADPVLMHSAIENIIRNALRYTPAESEVKVSLKKESAKLMIIIKDQGVGVPDDALQRLFEPFARISEARDRKTGGFGLGLAITGRVIKAHGGEVFAKNRAEAGLSIYIRLPLF
jgi:signal transduction histidine kinase